MTSVVDNHGVAVGRFDGALFGKAPGVAAAACLTVPEVSLNGTWELAE